MADYSPVTMKTPGQHVVEQLKLLLRELDNLRHVIDRAWDDPKDDFHPTDDPDRPFWFGNWAVFRDATFPAIDRAEAEMQRLYGIVALVDGEVDPTMGQLGVEPQAMMIRKNKASVPDSKRINTYSCRYSGQPKE